MNENKKQFRHELKYLISTAQVPMVQNQIRHLLLPDSHAAPNGRYTVRSLYFDDYENRCYYENENGTDPREKFRIRIYNGCTDRIVLECKRKENGMSMKTACSLTQEQAHMLVKGIPIADIGNQPQPLQNLTKLMLLRHFRPVVIVEYERIPYVYKSGNVRITMDTNIASSTAIGHFFDPEIPKRPVMPTGQQLMEVKYDAFLPDFIYQNLQLQNLQQTSFSKYYVCRKYTR